MKHRQQKEKWVTYSHKFINSHRLSISTNHHDDDVKYNTEWEDLSLFPPNAIKIVKNKKVKKAAIRNKF